MEFLASVHTDVGIKKKTNQDSVLIMEAETESGNVMLAVMCDGMGGLSKGEVASAALIKAFSDWFCNDLPALAAKGLDQQSVFGAFGSIANDMNINIGNYGSRIGVNLGTTVAACLFANDTYYIMNVGDSRVYRFSDNIYQLTKDQTVIQREMDLGRMTPEEAMVSSQRNVLLQCIGASEIVVPDFYSEPCRKNEVFLLCCDGFRHVITPAEMLQRINPNTMTDERVMRETLVYFTELNKSRMETDNISAILVKVC